MVLVYLKTKNILCLAKMPSGRIKGHGLGCSEQFSMRVAAEEEVLGGYGLLRRRALVGGEGPSGTLLSPFILNSD